MILGDVPSLHELNVLIFDLANDFLERFADDMEHCTHLQRTRIRQACFHLAAKAIHNNEKLRQGHARQNLNELKFEFAKLKREQTLARNVNSVNKSVNLCNSFTPPPPPLPKPGPPTEADLAFDRFVADNTAKAEAAAAAAEAANPTPQPTPTTPPTPPKPKKVISLPDPSSRSQRIRYNYPPSHPLFRRPDLPPGY
ncbi:MAG: hypothetical protein LBT73_03420 [Tannerellaceae bacterium]|jgi:hypothetical protein|nr:hypothetical protein [Tannerellaceae bacterium]